MKYMLLIYADEQAWTDSDPGKSERVMQALLRMKKIDISGLKRAHEQN